MVQHGQPPNGKSVSPLALALLSWLVILEHWLFIASSWSCACRCLASACALVWLRSSSLVWSLASCSWILNISTPVSNICLASAFSCASCMGQWERELIQGSENNSSRVYHYIRLTDSLCLPTQLFFFTDTLFQLNTFGDLIFFLLLSFLMLDIECICKHVGKKIKIKKGQI